MIRTEFETERLLLRLADPCLAEATTRYFIENRDFLAPFEPAKEDSYFTVDFQRAMLITERELAEDDRCYRFYLSRKDAPSEIIGGANLNEVVRKAYLSSFVGYKLDHRYLRCGYMSEAVIKLCEIAFVELGLHRLEANIMPRNTASLKTARKAGFLPEGISRDYLKINGVWEDHIHMVRLNEQMD